MKHKILLTGLTLLFSLSLSAETHSGTCGDNLTWTLDTESGVLTISGTGAMKVTEAPWYSSRFFIKSVEIADGVTSIGDYAFLDAHLTSITIPNSVTIIGKSAFYNSSLKSIEIPNSVTSIGGSAFYDCPLTSIEIPNSVTSIGKSAFNDCSSLTSVTVESGNKTYDSRNNCNAIIETATNTLIVGCQNTIIPNSVTSIGEDAFHGCWHLTSIDIPNSVTSIGNRAFANCGAPYYGYGGLESIEIPNSVTSIGESAFFGCSSLTSIEIPNT